MWEGWGLTPEQAFGQVLRELRTERDLSQEEFADRCRVSRPHVSRLETGKNSPSLSMLFQLADALGVAPEELVRRVGRKLQG